MCNTESGPCLREPGQVLSSRGEGHCVLRRLPSLGLGLVHGLSAEALSPKQGYLVCLFMVFMVFYC